MVEYNKPPLTYEEQISLLKSRGLIIADENQAKKRLSNINYYRLSAYMYPYKQRKNRDVLNMFKEGTTWEMIYQLYEFDRKLRILVFDAIERLEISIRTQIAYQLSHKYGSHWQNKREIFYAPKTIKLADKKEVTVDVFSEIQKHIEDQLNNNKAEEFIIHYKTKYDNPKMPPSWMCVEIMYFSHLSKICNNLEKRSDISGISSYFDLPPNIFCSWLHSINYVRNICAHHARLWNRDMNIVPAKLSSSKNLIWIGNPTTVKRRKVYYFLCMLNYLLQTVNPSSPFKKRFKDLLNEYKNYIFLDAMGIPEDWEKEKIWRM